MKLSEILGQPRATTHLQNALEQDRLAHGLIFAGPAGVGKRTTALALARALFCTAEIPDGTGGCEQCEDCHLIEAGTHPNLLIQDMARAREEKSTASQISIAQIRRLRSDLALRGVRGHRKVAIIEPAEKLTTDAQNALLKTLEEPPAGSVLILVTSNADALLPTIRSRCQRIHFSPLSPSHLATILGRDGYSEEEASNIASIADGSLHEAARLSSEESQEQSLQIRERLSGLQTLSTPELLDFAAELASGKGEERRDRMALQGSIFLDWARARMVEAAENNDPEGTRASLKILKRIHGTTRDLSHYANAQLTWESLLLDLREMRP
jgi:DNA polymerase-3 subunit delta'